MTPRPAIHAHFLTALRASCGSLATLHYLYHNIQNSKRRMALRGLARTRFALSAIVVNPSLLLAPVLGPASKIRKSHSESAKEYNGDYARIKQRARDTTQSETMTSTSAEVRLDCSRFSHPDPLTHLDAEECSSHRVFGTVLSLTLYSIPYLHAGELPN